MKTSILALCALLSTTLAHFEILSPAGRDGEENSQGQFPCGGANSVSSTRTPFPLTGGRVTIAATHVETNLEILIAIGPDPGSAFNTILRRTFSAVGLGSFCVGNLTIPSSLNVAANTPATIQVVTNGHAGGGLYACADVTLVESVTQTDDCSLGSITIENNDLGTHANGSAYAGGAAVSSVSSGAPTGSSTRSAGASSTSSAATTSTSAAAGGSGAGMVSAGLGGVVVAGLAAVGMVL